MKEKIESVNKQAVKLLSGVGNITAFKINLRRYVCLIISFLILFTAVSTHVEAAQAPEKLSVLVYLRRLTI